MRKERGTTMRRGARGLLIAASLAASGTLCAAGLMGLSMGLGLGLASQPAAARIVCKGGNQLIRGQWISTPYCEDTRIAEVAAEYGMRVSAKEVRNNPNVKLDVCRLIGQDIRVDMACATVLPQLRSPGFP